MPLPGPHQGRPARQRSLDRHRHPPRGRLVRMLHHAAHGFFEGFRLGRTGVRGERARVPGSSAAEDERRRASWEPGQAGAATARRANGGDAVG